jgi:hypothetical protein
MSDVQTTTGSGLAVPSGPDENYTGLEDFDPNKDAVVPRIKIDHAKGVFVDGQTSQEFHPFTVVLLTLVKQRILWEPEQNDDAKPLCKSYDFDTGFPDVTTFPWKESHLSFDDATAQAQAAGLERVELPCQACNLKEWETDPKSGKAPWCTEQHTYPLLYQTVDDPDAPWLPALLTFQKTGIKPSKTYCTPFSRTETPLFTVFTTLTLTTQKRGNVTFATPTFAKGDSTDQADWPEYRQLSWSMRQYLRTPPTAKDEATAETAVDAPAASSPAPSQPAPAGDAAADDDEVPF